MNKQLIHFFFFFFDIQFDNSLDNGALAFIKQSPSKLGLTHKTYIGDRDNKSYLNAAKAVSNGSLVDIA